jgi:hypothetical protein
MLEKVWISTTTTGCTPSCRFRALLTSLKLKLMIGLNNILLIDVRRRQMTRKSLKVLKE